MTAPYVPVELEALVAEHLKDGHWCGVCHGQESTFARLLATVAKQQDQLRNMNETLQARSSNMTPEQARIIELHAQRVQLERDRYAGALTEIADADYRGNPTPESAIAQKALGRDV